MTPSAAPPTTVWSEMQLLCFVAADVALSLEGTPLSISQPQTFFISRFVGSTDEASGMRTYASTQQAGVGERLKKTEYLSNVHQVAGNVTAV